MQVNRLEQWLSPFKATVEGQSLCALENRPEILPAAQLCINSKQLKEGDIFLALPGVTCHGNQFTLVLKGFSDVEFHHRGKPAEYIGSLDSKVKSF